MIWTFTLVGVLVSLHGEVDSFSCAPPEFRGTTPCEIPKCCESGQLTTEVCSGCPTCAAAKDEECGAGFEAFQPACSSGLSCFTRCGPCTTEVNYDEDGQALKANTCVFPFKYKNETHNKCTTADSDNNKPWCAYDIQPNTEVPQDGKHWGDCNYDCPGGDSECDENQLFNVRGKCVPKMQEVVRIARPFTHNFRAGLTDTKPIKKCSEEGPYIHQRIKDQKCYCLPPQLGPKQEGEGCTKKLLEDTTEEQPFIFDAGNLPGVNGPPPPPPPSGDDFDDDFKPARGWCFLGGVKDPRYYEPETHCYDDLQWSETEQKYWSTSACDDVPEGGVQE